MILTTTPYWLKLSGKIIIELPTMELAMATPVMNTDFPIGIIMRIINVISIKVIIIILLFSYPIQQFKFTLK